MSHPERTLVLINTIRCNDWFWGNESFDYPDELETLMHELCSMKNEYLPSCAAAHMFGNCAEFVFSSKQDAETAYKMRQVDHTNYDGRTEYVSEVYFLSELEPVQEKIRKCIESGKSFAEVCA